MKRVFLLREFENFWWNFRVQLRIEAWAGRQRYPPWPLGPPSQLARSSLTSPLRVETAPPCRRAKYPAFIFIFYKSHKRLLTGSLFTDSVLFLHTEYCFYTQSTVFTHSVYCFYTQCVLFFTHTVYLLGTLRIVLRSFELYIMSACGNIYTGAFSVNCYHFYCVKFWKNDGLRCLIHVWDLNGGNYWRFR